MLFLWCPYFSNGCWSLAELPPMVSGKKNKKKKTSIAVMSRGNGLSTECILTGKCVKRCVSKSFPSAGIAETSDGQVPCAKGAFCLSDYSLAALCLSLFPTDECDFPLSRQRQPIFRMSRWFTVRLQFFSSA